MREVNPMSVAEAIGHAKRSGDVQALAAAVLSHPGSRALPRSAVLACAKVAYSRNLPAEATHDLDLVRSLAATVLETELSA